MTFDLMYKEECKKTLASLLESGRFPHAILFEGSAGAGKRVMAYYAAAMLLCREQNRPCQICRVCRKIKSLNHPDIIVFDGGDKLRSIGVDIVRDIRRQAYISANESEFKIFIIAQAHNMTVEAQNALLKILEDPPETARFILTAISRNNMLETIKSRVTAIPVDFVAQEEIEDALLLLSPKSSMEDIKSAASVGETIGQAMQILKNLDGNEILQDADKMIDLALNGRKYDLMVLLSSYQNNREGFLTLVGLGKKEAAQKAGTNPKIMTPLRCREFADILDNAYMSASQNVGLLILTALMADQLCEA